MPSGCHGADERFLDLSQVPVQILLVPLEIDDGVADELPRAVERDVAAALDLEQLDPPRGEQCGRRQQMALLRRAPEGDDRRMLDEKQQVLVDLAADPRPGHRSLELQRVRVRHGAEIETRADHE